MRGGQDAVGSGHSETVGAQRLDQRQCADLLGVSRSRVWWWIRTGKFAAPSGEAKGRPSWTRDDVLRWAVGAPYGLAGRATLDFWPTPKRAADYRGAVNLGTAVALVWRAEVGTIAMLWGLPGRSDPNHQDLVSQLPRVDIVVRVNFDFGFDGPALDAFPIEDPKRLDTFVRCSELARVLGQPFPYWPIMLRDPALLTKWQPGAKAVTALTLCDVNAAALLRMAALYDADEPASRALVHLTRVVQYRDTASAKRDLEILAGCAASGAVFIAAHPLDVPETHREDLDPVIRRAGWLDILHRTDALADQCVSELMLWDGGKDSPFGLREQIELSQPHGAEWAQRLERVDRTAAHRLLGDPSDFLETLVDPLTDAPVARKHKAEGDYLVTVSLQRLPTTSPLAELILDRPIWVRTAEGNLYPAPHGTYFGTSWGYPGTGPGSLALMIHQLLDDITAHGPEGASGASPGLERLTEIKFRPGTVLRRDQLEAARRGEWLPEPSAEE